MKVPPKRKGNPLRPSWCGWCRWFASMKVPPKRKGNQIKNALVKAANSASMKVPPKRKGKRPRTGPQQQPRRASMKVPPKRKGKLSPVPWAKLAKCLNESPSEKEGKTRNSGRR